jgi:hypothetical protein
MSSGEAYDMEASFLYPINYNWIIAGGVYETWSHCVMAGIWGLMWYNDGGEMMQECFGLGSGGALAEYIEA